MDTITTGHVMHVGTFNGNPLCMAAARAVLDEICAREATDQLIERNRGFAADCGAILSRAGMPAHVVQFSSGSSALH